MLMDDTHVVHHPFQESADRPGITRSRFGSLLLHVFCCLVHQACEVTSRIRLGRGVGFHRPHGMSSRLDGPLHRWAMPSRGPTCLRVVRRGLSSAARTLARPWFGRGRGHATELCPPKTPVGALRELVRPDLSANPLRGDSVGSGGRHIGEVHWVGVAEKRPLFVGSGRHETWRCRDQE